MSIEKRRLCVDAERRRFPRVAIVIPVKLERSKEETVAALIQNISPGGMQVRLSAQSAARLLSKRGEIKKAGLGSFTARFLVPLRNQHVPICVDCAVAHVSPVDGAPKLARIAIGIRFKRFKDANILRRFVLFIEEQLVPLEDYELYLHGRASPRKRSSPGGTKTN